MNSIVNIKETANKILSIAQNGNENYIFGAGWMGKALLNSFSSLNIPVSGFVVSKKNIDTEQKIPIYDLAEITSYKDKKNIFIALRDQDEDLSRNLKELFDYACPVTYPKDITALEASFYMQYLTKKYIDFNNKETCIIDSYTFINPFFKPDDYLLSWVYEAGDLILPILFKDNSHIDEGPYETEHTSLKCGEIVLDCGANIGLFSGIAAQKNCHVYAFEPMPDAIAYLKEVQKLHSDKITICPYALSDKRGKAVFHVQNNDLIGSSLYENHNTIDKKYDVNLETIDSYVEEHQLPRVDYIKADIEGAERDMLRGAIETIKKFRPKISICTYHLEDDKEVLEEIIKSIEPKYIITHQWKKLYAYVP